MFDVKSVSFAEFKNVANDKEGIVLYGTGGDLAEWIDGIANILHKEGISSTAIPTELFTEMYVLNMSGRTDLALVVDFDNVQLGKMAVWRLVFGDCSWISDYIPNNDPSKSVVAWDEED